MHHLYPSVHASFCTAGFDHDIETVRRNASGGKLLRRHLDGPRGQVLIRLHLGRHCSVVGDVRSCERHTLSSGRG